MDSPDPGTQDQKNQSQETMNVDVVEQGPPASQANSDPDPEPEEVAQLVRQLIQFVEALKKGEEVPSRPLDGQRSNSRSFSGQLIVPSAHLPPSLLLRHSPLPWECDYSQTMFVT